MLEFTIEQTPDPTLQGKLKRTRPILTVGSSSTCDLFIQDSEINPLHLIIEQRENDYAIYSPTSSKFLLNGKKSEGSLSLRVGDTIKIGETIFKIQFFSLNNEIKTTADEIKTLSETLPSLPKVLRTISKILGEKKS